MMQKLGVAVALAFAVVSGIPSAGAAQTAPGQVSVRDGQRDFDWEIGIWTTKVKVRRNPLSGAAPDWAEYEGTSVIKPLLGGRSNFVELSVADRAARSRADR